jgi:hypothetical protein
VINWEDHEMDTRTQDTLARDESGNLISSRKVEGTTVYNRQGESLGTIDHVMIDKFTGQVAYAVMSFGGFLGIGEKYHPLPWQVLDYDVTKGGYAIECDKRALEKAPMYETNDASSWTDRGWRKRVDDYYAPYI